MRFESNLAFFLGDTASAVCCFELLRYALSRAGRAYCPGPVRRERAAHTRSTNWGPGARHFRWTVGIRGRCAAIARTRYTDWAALPGGKSEKLLLPSDTDAASNSRET